MIKLIIFGDLTMDIAHLKTFLEIYQIRHFGKAAEKLFITQSAASARIKLLEEQLGVKLFTRDKRLITPTPAGHRFHKYAEIVVFGWEQARQVIALPDEYKQSLSIACMADIWHLFLNHWVVDIQKHHNDLALNLTINQANDISELLVNSALDLGFMFEPARVPALGFQEILTFPIKLFSTSPTATVREALSEDYIMVDWGASFAYEYAQAFEDMPTATIQTNYGIMALDLLKSRGGAAYLPELAVATINQETNLTLHQVKEAPVFERKLYAIFHKNSDVDKQVVEVIQTIKKLLLEMASMHD